MKIVETTADSLEGVLVFAALSMIAEQSHTLDEVGVVRNEHSRIPGRAEILGGVEAEAPDGTDCAGSLAIELCSVSLRRIFDDRQPAGYACQAVHVGRMPVKVNGDDGLGSLTEVRLDRLRVEVQGLVFDVGEDGAGTVTRYGLGGGNEAKRGRDHFVTGPDPESLEGEEKCVTSAPHTASRGNSAKSRELPFERAAGLALDERALPKNFFDGVVDLSFQALVLRLQINDRDHDGSSVCFSGSSS